MTILTQQHQGVMIARKSIPELREAVRITKQLRLQDIKLPPNRARSGGSAAYYFACSKPTATSIKVANIRYRYGSTQGTLTDQTKTIPTTAGTYYIYFQALYLTSYTISIEVSTVDTHPDQADAGSSRAWREEICAVTVADSVISNFAPIWPGHIMAIEGRVV